MMTPLRASSDRTRKRAMALATMRAFAKVKSSAMIARQPSVPNLMGVISFTEAVGSVAGDCVGGVILRKVYAKEQSRKEPHWLALKQVFSAILLEPFHDFADVLGAMARANQQGVRRFDHHQVADSDGGDEFRRAPDEVSFRFEQVSGAGQDIVRRSGSGLFVHGGPG